jgi:hypothetical protein
LLREYGEIVRVPTLTSLKDGRSSAKAVADKAGESESRDGYATRTQGLVGEMPGESVCGSRNAERGDKR